MLLISVTYRTQSCLIAGLDFLITSDKRFPKLSQKSTLSFELRALLFFLPDKVIFDDPRPEYLTWNSFTGTRLPDPITNVYTQLSADWPKPSVRSVPRQTLSLDLLVIYGAAIAAVTTAQCFDKKIRSVPHLLQPPAIDKATELNAKIYVNQMARRHENSLRHEHFCAKYRYFHVFSSAVLNRFLSEDFFNKGQRERESISRCLTTPNPSKTQNWQMARTPLLTKQLLRQFST